MFESTIRPSTKFVVDITEEEPIHVLHVDDEVGFLKVAKECLEMDESFQVDIASSVEEAILKMEKETFDVIICDYMMPEKDGLEFLKELRESGNTIPFIVFTGKGREEVAIKALNLGADRYLNKAGDPETVYGELAYSIRQVREKTLADEKIRESEEELRSVFEAATDGIAHVDTSGRIVAANRRLVEELLGYRLDETIGKNFAELGRIEPKELPRVLEAMKETVNTGKEVRNFEVTLVRKDNRRIPVEVSTGVLKKEGKVAGITTIIRDITDRRKAEELYKNVVELAQESILTVDVKGVITSCNTTATKLLGYSREELVGKHFSRIGVIRVKDLPKYFKLFSLALRGKITKPIELNFYRKDGTPLLCEVHIGLLKDKGGKIIGIQTVSKDITDRKKAEQALIENQQKFKGLFKDNPEAAVYVDPDFHVLDINPRFKQLFGYNLEEIKGKQLLDVIVPLDKLEEGKMLDEKAKRGHIYYDTIRKRNDGSLV
ncbi:MAG: PAS domain S-box protein, partial [Candidatus Bathyarchaeota archaeon]